MIPNDLRLQIRRLQLRARRAVSSRLAGAYHSAFKGSGLAFADVREYQPGDDIRTIDWNVSARTGHPHIKQFTEERELTLLLILDRSASVEFGSGMRTKHEVAVELAAFLVFAALENHDQFALIHVTDRVEQFIPPRHGGNHALQLLRAIVNFTPAHPGTDLTAALEFTARVCRRRGIVVIFSDFIDPSYESSLRRLARQHEVIAVRLIDPWEQELPSLGLLRLQDAETGEQRLVDTSSAEIRTQFAESAAKRQQQFLRLVRSAGADPLEINTEGDSLGDLIRFFELRERQRRHR
jgi:uncharacterized protein (DUF58 family)